MIGVDSNMLVYAHREDSEWHRSARDCVASLAEGGSPWAIPWPCIHEFLAIVTHPKIYRPPTPLVDAIRQVEFWFESPALQTIGERVGHLASLKKILTTGSIQGGAVHDARIAAICLENGVKILWSADRNFTRIAGLRVVNPLLG